MLLFEDTVGYSLSEFLSFQKGNNVRNIISVLAGKCPSKHSDKGWNNLISR